VADHEFETVASETIYVGPVFAVREDKVRMPQDRTARRQVVEHMGAVAVLAIDDNANLVLIRQYRHSVGHRLWELPAGLLDVDGEPPQLTAARELEEEAGLEAASWHTLVDLVTSPGFCDEAVRVYLATGLTEIGRPEAHDEEADLTVSRVPLKAAVQMALRGEIVNSIAVSGILAAAAVDDVSALRSADAPWPDRPRSFAARRGA